MIYYFFFFSLITTTIAFFSLRVSAIILVIGCSVFLYLLPPSVGGDYSIYQNAVENSYVSKEYPWFKTEAGFSSEPLYLFYSSLLGVLLFKGYKLFMIANFIICYLISFLALRRCPYKNIFFFFWIATLPVIFPTIFYGSPRSSISFFFVLAGFFLLVDMKYLLSFCCFSLGVSFHSQYLFSSGVIISCYFLLKNSRNISKKLILYSLLALISICLFNIKFVLGLILFVFSFLPSGDIASAKMHYFEDARSGIRFTSILSIFVYPILIYLFRSVKQVFFFKEEEKEHMAKNLFLAMILSAGILNIIFFNNPHVAGRLSRFSDYSSLTLLVPIFFLAKSNSKTTVLTILFIINLISPLIYKSIYY
ncbi:MAG: hypothetical protein D3922_00400 [Candidatus Electrothrix sp. AR1]|nr:hypothetical protein [Candidatus Electrothrix sp. AR1]